MREGSRPVVNDTPDTARLQRSASCTHPEMVAGGRAGQGRSARSQVSTYRISCRSSERNSALAIAFAGDSYKLLVLHLTDPQSRQLGDTHPGRVQEFENRPISQFKWLPPLQRIQAHL